MRTQRQLLGRGHLRQIRKSQEIVHFKQLKRAAIPSRLTRKAESIKLCIFFCDEDGRHSISSSDYKNSVLMERVRYTTREEFGFIFHISVQPGSYSVRVSGPQGYRQTFEGPRDRHVSLRSDDSERRKVYNSPPHLDDSESDVDDDPSSNNGRDDDEEDEPSTHDSETGYRLGAGKGKGKSASLATLRLLRRTGHETLTRDEVPSPCSMKPIHLDFQGDEADSSSGSDGEGT